jgi:excisionase family DNA binding protein
VFTGSRQGPFEREEGDMDAITPQDAYSVEDFARRHGIGRTTVYAEVKEGRLTVHKVRGRTLIFAEDAKAWRESMPKKVIAA